MITQAVKQLHREFLRAGSDVCQAFTFYASEDKLKNRGNSAGTHGVSSTEYIYTYNLAYKLQYY